MMEFKKQGKNKRKKKGPSRKILKIRNICKCNMQSSVYSI